MGGFRARTYVFNKKKSTFASMTNYKRITA